MSHVVKVSVQNNIDAKSFWNCHKHWPTCTMILFAWDQNRHRKLNVALWSHVQWLMGMMIQLIQGSCPPPGSFLLIQLTKHTAHSFSTVETQLQCTLILFRTYNKSVLLCYCIHVSNENT